jgi:hypothetical protein
MKMRRFWFLTLVLGLLSVFSGAIGLRSHAEMLTIRGDYVEVRTASVFAGACHYNGEVTTTGHDALMAWKVTSGQWRGVDLTGVRAVAIVSADANLSDNNAARRSEIIIGQEATDSQTTAMLEALKRKYASAFGKIISVRRDPLSFEHEGRAYAVNADNLASITVEAMPNDLCCKMPNLVWYLPLVPLENRKVGYTKRAFYAGAAVSEPWQRSGENSAFYGTFSF